MATLLELILAADKDIFSEEILPEWHTGAHSFFIFFKSACKIEYKKTSHKYVKSEGPVNERNVL